MPHRRKFFRSQDVPLNVLIIDNSYEFCGFLKETLRVILPETSRIEALSSIEESRKLLSKKSFDCILIDVSLSIKVAEPYFEELLDLYSHIAIIVMTPTHDMDIALNIISAGAEDYLVKEDCSADNLLKSIRYSAERRVAKNETQRLTQALEKEKQLRALQHEFIALVTHEFRTPLAIVHNAAQMISMKLSDESRRPVQDRLLKIASCVTRLTQLIDTVVLYSKVEEGHFVFQPETFVYRCYCKK